MPSLFGGEMVQKASESVAELFGYNRENFQYDRQMRQNFEYKLAEMRIEQVALWRKDVRDAMEITPKKMEVYLLVIALELNAAATAICKGRVAPGAPAWLCACHTLGVCSAVMFLLLALWFGLHAFVASQAYKVRILTQLVRLPIPTWQELEAGRTYSSAFERVPGKQMLRIPFVMGSQERHAARRAAQNAAAGSQRHTEEPADPWGLERSGEAIPELRPDVNTSRVARQQHVWMVREAAKFYQAYDAFCRICMSAGTSSLGTFFCYYCLCYVSTENAAPMAAWCGMAVFSGITIMLMRTELLLTRWQQTKAAALLMAGPTLCAVVAFYSSKYHGDPGRLEFLMPVALFLQGAWFQYYLHLIQTKLMQTGSMLPTAFRAVLYVDPFGWVQHTRAWWRSSSTGTALTLPAPAGPESSAPVAPPRWRRSAPPSALPAMQCVDTSAARRPEDARREGSALLGEWLVNPADRQPVGHEYLNPKAFATFYEDEDEEEEEDDGDAEDASSVSSSSGQASSSSRLRISSPASDTPGLIPWHSFHFSTMAVTAMWWVASGMSVIGAVKGNAIFVFPKYGLGDEEVAPLPALLGVRMEIGWDAAPVRPNGLACDPSGRLFATSGVDREGRKRLLMAQLGDAEARFVPAGACPGLDHSGDGVSDLALHGCDVAATSAGKVSNGCRALVLPRSSGKSSSSSDAKHLISCPLRRSGGPKEETEEERTAFLQGASRASRAEALNAAKAQAAPLSRGWLEDRGGHSENGEQLLPEEPSALALAPCRAAQGGGGGSHEACLVMGTTAKRLVQLSLLTQPQSSGSDLAEGPRFWVPRRLLQPGNGEAPSAGSLAVISERYLGVLHKNSSALSFVDLHQNGRPVGQWRLPKVRGHDGGPTRWAAVCSAGDALYALEDKEAPHLWRFQAPKELLPDHRSGSGWLQFLR